MVSVEYFLVYGGEMVDVATRQFKDSNNLDIVGIFDSYEEAYKAWRGAAQRTVDNAQTRYFVAEIGDIQKTSKDPSSD